LPVRVHDTFGAVVAMKLVLRMFATVHAVLALLFVAVALLLVAVAGRTVWEAIEQGLEPGSGVTLIEAMGLFAVAVVALQIAQTIAEEEVVRQAHVSAPTRVRRFLSRFVVVIVVALAIEGLVATMKALHEDMGALPAAAATVVSVGVLLAAWGCFVRLNRSAEEIEPEAMQQAKEEDRKVQ
jgi:hypothetical protein